ncbi:MAG: beta-propeller fold lactonase family protein [Burkholderiales bacterium]|nr:beta-propeller fold lactonase family protein [Phycisphaerae bacterium]
MLTKISRPLFEALESRSLLSSGFVFVATNHNNTEDPKSEANEVVAYRRADDGKLTLFKKFSTGGQGSGPSVRFAGDGLGSAHSVQLSQDKKFLFVANAASDNVSVFRVGKGGLKLVDIEPTGDFPNSITQRGNRVYVLNAAGHGSITGFKFDSAGELSRLSNSTRNIQANQDEIRPDTLFNPVQVSFTPNGKHLVVSIKDGPKAGALPGVTPTGPGRVLVFDVDNDGRPSKTFERTDFNNRGPFGFSFDTKGRILLTLFVGGPVIDGAITSSVGSYSINSAGHLVAITLGLNNDQIDSCWIENNGKYAFSANYTSNTISSYRVGADGKLTLINKKAAVITVPDRIQGATPIDIRISADGKFLYNVLPGAGKVGAWRINSNGSLASIGSFGGLTRTINGDHAPHEFGSGGSPAGIEVT